MTKLSGISFLYAVLLLHQCSSIFYPPLYWQKDNCGFSRLQSLKDSNTTKEHFIKVLPYSAMNIVCPNVLSINNWLKGNEPQRHTLFENLWMVDELGYDNCMVNGLGDPKINKLLLVCDNPQKVKQYKLFAFHPRYNMVEPKFAPGKHYYFISTSRGYANELSTRNVSGPRGSCVRYNMRLHIYVCDPSKEDCVWEMPRCRPDRELYREMQLIDGRLPAPTLPSQRVVKRSTTTSTSKTVRPKTTKFVPVRKTTRNNRPTQVQTTSSDVVHKRPICQKKKKGTSIHLILNFVLGGVALFMAIVIIILVYGLSEKSKKYKVERPASAISSTHGHNDVVSAQVVRYSDGHAELYPVLISRTPPTSPNYIVAPNVHRTSSPPPQHTPPPCDRNSKEERAFVFPVQRRHSADDSRRDSRDSDSESGTTRAIVYA